jgi:hypothetical protein
MSTWDEGMSIGNKENQNVASPIEPVASSELELFKSRLIKYLNATERQKHPLFDTNLYNEGERRIIIQIMNYINNSN